jgi:hypothetical protein
LIALKAEGKRIVGYAAAANGNTLLNFCGIGRDFLDYTVDLSPHKEWGGTFAVRTPEFALVARVSQCNTSFNAAAGTLRGVHFQTEPHGQAKLVRCTRGAIPRRDRGPAAGLADVHGVVRHRAP